MPAQKSNQEQTAAQAPEPWGRSPDEPDVIVDAAGQPVARFIQQPGRSLHANLDRVLTVLYACLPWTGSQHCEHMWEVFSQFCLYRWRSGSSQT